MASKSASSGVKDIDLNQIQGNVIVQPKLDGLRVTWNKDTAQLYTRNGNVITSCDHIIAEIYALGLQNQPLDGEIYATALPFETINGLVRKQQPEADTLKLQYHLFDVINGQSATDRAKWLQCIKPSAIIKPVATFFTTHSKLQELYQCFLDSGCEGMIIRDPNSTAVYRVKPVQDMEATLIGFQPTTSLAHQHSFGSLILQLPSGKTFKCAGFSEAQRHQLWQQQPLGQLVTILFKGLTANGIPREPRFKAIRHDIAGVAA